MPEQQEWSQESVEKQIAEQPEPKVEEAKPQAEPEPETPKVKVDFVPQQALHEAKLKGREAKAEAQLLRQRVEQMEREMTELRQKSQPQPQAPDPSVDPAAAILYQQQLTQKQIQELQQNRQQEIQQNQQRQQFESFVGAVRAKSAEYVQAVPEAEHAIDFLKKSRVDEYKAMGMSQTEAHQRMLRDEMDLSAWALQNGDNPAEVAHNMAKARGFVAPQKKLDMQKDGQGASMPSGGGGKSGGLPSYDTLLKMSSEDFAKATSGDGWAKLMNR